jgi:hypothetical protein
MVNSGELIGSSEHLILDEVSRNVMSTFAVFCDEQ